MAAVEAIGSFLSSSGAVTAAAITSTVGTIYSAEQQYHGAKQADKIADKNAELAKLEMAEADKRAKQAASIAASEGRLAVAAGGATGSLNKYLETVALQTSGEINFMNQGAQSRLNINKASDKATAGAARAGAIGTLANAPANWMQIQSLNN